METKEEKKEELNKVLQDIIKDDNVEKLRELLDAGLNPDRVISTRLPLLSFAVRANKEEIVKLLLEKGANVNFKTSQGASALYWAIDAGNPTIARLLLEKGAKTSIQDLEDAITIHYGRWNAEWKRFPQQEQDRFLLGYYITLHLMKPLTFEKLDTIVKKMQPRFEPYSYSRSISEEIFKKIVKRITDRLAVASISRGQRIYGPSLEANIETNEHYPKRLALPYDIQKELHQLVNYRGGTQKRKRSSKRRLTRRKN